MEEGLAFLEQNSAIFANPIDVHFGFPATSGNGGDPTTASAQIELIRPRHISLYGLESKPSYAGTQLVKYGSKKVIEPFSLATDSRDG